ncbi:MAG TPA: AbrB/MazE/SpoVT family DNA-binding domain-containing protein [Dehalococcoidia bacterium]
MANRARSPKTGTVVTQVGSRGTLTLPAEVRRALGIQEGTVLIVRVEGSRIVLQPAAVVPVELYTDERIAEFEESAAMTPEELSQARARWKQGR